MRFFVARMFHESSIFSPGPTVLASFASWGDGEREPINPADAGKHVLGYGDLLDAVVRSGHQALQGPHFEAQSSAPMDAATFADLSERIPAEHRSFERPRQRPGRCPGPAHGSLMCLDLAPQSPRCVD
jgi:microcystin degradation protein MlrC